MAVRVRFARRVGGGMGVLMVLVVYVLVLVLYWIVHVLMIVFLGYVKPDTDRHQCAGSRKLDRQRLTKEDYGRYRSKKWSRREVGAGTRCAEVSKRPNEERQADAVANEPDDAGEYRGVESGKISADR